MAEGVPPTLDTVRKERHARLQGVLPIETYIHSHGERES